MNDKYLEELADYVMKHKAPVVLSKRIVNVDSASFSIDSAIHQNRLEVIEKLKTNEKYRNRCEEKRRNMEELKWNFGKK